MSEVDFEEINKEVIACRRHLHAYPELSFKEYETSEFIIKKLQSFGGFKISRVAKTGVVATFEAMGATKTIAFRADIDALYLEEKNSFEFSSKNKNVMHACGHDAHTAILLGVAKALSLSANLIKCNILFIFQCGEEIAPGGAAQLVDKGVMDGVCAVFALHLMPGLKCGSIGVKSGVATANKDSFEILVTGRGGHSSMPQKCIDPILVASQIVVNLQSIVSRNLDPFSTGVISLASFKSGQEYGVIPQSAHMSGAIRSFDSSVRRLMKERLCQITKNIAIAHNASAEVKFLESDFGAIYNDPEICEILKDIIIRNFGEDSFVRQNLPQSFSEDFSHYLTKTKGAMLWLGVDNDSGVTHELHSPYFDPNEKAFIVGVKFFYAIAREFFSHEL